MACSPADPLSVVVRVRVMDPLALHTVLAPIFVHVASPLPGTLVAYQMLVYWLVLRQ